ncbi:transcriptional regulator [Microbacterium testaceum]|uniref:Transcriptional regulator n=1 Tax=Microbacterium testaceum TaxID=2033 RepID=A0A147ETS8_MICTE|nr:transcriptional regulator [Microbacterium testaceum]KTR90243.1 transcriptional regulator [Microbacterium testaceum]
MARDPADDGRAASVAPRFDEAIHAPTRLRICAMLRPLAEADFADVRAALDLSDAHLSKTLRALVDLGYVSTTKQPSPERADERRTTRVSLTPLGRAVFDAHFAALRAMAPPDA